MQGCSYSCVVATPDSKALYVVGSDKKLKELEEVGGTGTQVTKELDTGVLVNSIVLPAGMPAMHALPALGFQSSFKHAAKAWSAKLSMFDTCHMYALCSVGPVVICKYHRILPRVPLDHQLYRCITQYLLVFQCSTNCIHVSRDIALCSMGPSFVCMSSSCVHLCGTIIRTRFSRPFRSVNLHSVPEQIQAHGVFPRRWKSAVCWNRDWLHSCLQVPPERRIPGVPMLWRSHCPAHAHT